ncbi:MAG: HlyD family type I secretion periplasmic adaptor subunit [Pseudomonadota bacterium]
MSNLTTMSSRDIVEQSNFSDRLPAMQLPATPPTQVRKLVFWMIFLGFGLFGGLGTWAAITPMTSAVVAPGTFKVVGDRLVVQHLDGGIVREIHVQEGSPVEAGEVLVRLDATRIEAQVAILRSQLASTLSRNERLLAEQLGRESYEISDELIAMIKADPTLEPVVVSQQDIFQSNRAMLLGEIALLEGRIAQFEEQRANIDKRRASFQERYELVSAELKDLENLFSQGLVTRPRLTRLREDEITLITNVGIADGERVNVDQRISEIEERILQTRRDWMRLIADERQVLEAQIFDIRQRLDATLEVLDRVVIRAPRAGRVVNLNVNTLGGVIVASAPILEIVPQDTEFVIESRVSPADVDEVILGGSARVRLSAYSFRSTPPVMGDVTNISADSLVDPDTGEPYYQIDVVLHADAMDTLPHIKLLPGMPAQVLLETGEQTLGEYLINPVLAGAEMALNEGE